MILFIHFKLFILPDHKMELAKFGTHLVGATQLVKGCKELYSAVNEVFAKKKVDRNELRSAEELLDRHPVERWNATVKYLSVTLCYSYKMLCST